MQRPFPASKLPAIVPRMWHLKMAERGGEWVTVGSFETVAAATKKLVELEGYTSYGVFFEIFIEIGPGAHSETEAFGHLEHTGKNTRRCYASALARNDPTLLAKSDPAPPGSGCRICYPTRIDHARVET